MANPYQPPAAELPEPAPSSQRFRWLPVIVSGAGIDWLGSQIAGIAAGSIAAAVLLAQGTSADDTTNTLPTSPVFLVPSYVVGFLLTVLGGYVAARWAGYRFVAHAAASGAISLALGLPFILLASTFEWHIVIGCIVQVPLAMAGGWLAKRRLQRT